MNDQKNHIQTIISSRQLSQWHLMIASLLGSLASQQGLFNQSFLNRILKGSMSGFIIPYLESLPAYRDASEKIALRESLAEKLQEVVKLLDSVFELAGQVTLSGVEKNKAVVAIESPSCRFCPIGVGQAKLTSEMTFCPFPTMIEEIADYMIKEHQVKIVLHREGTKTKILTKKEGFCYITYEMS